MGILLGNISRHSWRARDAEYADSNGRLLIADRDNRMERPNLIPWRWTLPTERSDLKLWAYPKLLHYDRLRNEVLVLEFKFEIGVALSVA